MKTVATIGLVLLGYSAALPAQQEALVGKYAGSFVQKTKGGEEKIDLALEIASAQDGKLQGTVVRSEKGPCAGTQAVEGSYKANRISLHSAARAGDARRCGVRLQLVAEGDKLTGNFEFHRIQLVRQ